MASRATADLGNDHWQGSQWRSPGCTCSDPTGARPARATRRAGPWGNSLIHGLFLRTGVGCLGRATASGPALQVVLPGIPHRFPKSFSSSHPAVPRARKAQATPAASVRVRGRRRCKQRPARCGLRYDLGCPAAIGFPRHRLDWKAGLGRGIPRFAHMLKSNGLPNGTPRSRLVRTGAFVMVKT